MIKKISKHRIEHRNEFGDLHSENDIPAVRDKNGDCFWYKNGKFHRDNGLPAVIKTNGTKQWWVDGCRTREDGPAIEWCNGEITWILDGIIYNKEDFDEKILSKKMERFKEL